MESSAISLPNLWSPRVSLTEKAMFLIPIFIAFARAFVVGLSDEAGAAANVALAVKARQSPKPEEAARLDEYIQRTLWGVDQDIPFPVSLQDHASGGIRASLFWVPTPVCALLVTLACIAMALHLSLCHPFSTRHPVVLHVTDCRHQVQLV